MIDETQHQLKKVGLEMHEDKTTYLTTHPGNPQKLPGKNANDAGMRILGRAFNLGDNTTQDTNNKLGHAWSKFDRLQRVLGTQPPLPVKSCISQTLLFAPDP